MALRPVLALVALAATCQAFTAPMGIRGVARQAASISLRPSPRRASPANTISAMSMKEVAITPDFRLALGAVGLGIFFNQDLHVAQIGWPLVILGSFLILQTTRVRFRFSDTDLEVVSVNGLAEEGLTEGVESSGENMLQGGGANKWSLKSVTNWEYWFPGFPILVYFKETQTKPEGQIHFFPIIMDGKELYEQMFNKMGKSVNEKPAVEEWSDLRPLSPKGFKKISDKIQ